LCNQFQQLGWSGRTVIAATGTTGRSSARVIAIKEARPAHLVPAATVDSITSNGALDDRIGRKVTLTESGAR
jgi:2-methylisocitrate lyase-like PEP mutase family enzyme